MLPGASKSQHFSLSNVKGFARHRCEVISVGYGWETDAARYAYDNSTRQKFSLFQYTLSGEGRFRTGARTAPRTLAAPQAFLVNCPSPTGYWLPEGGTWEFLYIIFVGEMARWHVDQVIERRGHIFDLPTMSPAADLLRRTYHSAAIRAPLDKFTLSARLYQLLMELYRPEETAEPAGPNLDRAIRFIDQEYANTGLSVTDMARQTGLSPFHFSRLFRRQTGQSPYAYLTQVRMNHALNLLTLTQYPIKQVTQLVGFKDSSYFCKTFRQHHGRTPGSLRR